MDLKMMTDPEELKKVFIDEIIRDGKDTKDPYWEKISAEIQQCINQGQFYVKYVSPKACVKSLLMRRKSNLIQCLDELEKSFYCLTAYALNLCRNPQKKEYHCIKVYFVICCLSMNL